MRLDHVGIAVPDLKAALALFRTAFGLGGARAETLPGMKLRVARLAAGSAMIELVQPLPGETAVSKSLRERGPGLHHVAFAVPSLERAVARCRALGHVPVWDAPRRGAGGCRVLFLHPRTTGGTLIEFCELPKAPRRRRLRASRKF